MFRLTSGDKRPKRMNELEPPVNISKRRKMKTKATGREARTSVKVTFI